MVREFMKKVKYSIRETIEDGIPSWHALGKHLQKTWDALESRVSKNTPICSAFNYDMDLGMVLELYTMVLRREHEAIEKWLKETPSGSELELTAWYKCRVGYEKRMGSDAPRTCYGVKVILFNTKETKHFDYMFECKSFYPIAKKDASYCYWKENTDEKFAQFLKKSAERNKDH